jgi:hypothetical protein
MHPGSSRLGKKALEGNVPAARPFAGEKGVCEGTAD